MLRDHYYDATISSIRIFQNQHLTACNPTFRQIPYYQKNSMYFILTLLYHCYLLLVLNATTVKSQSHQSTALLNIVLQ